VDIWVEPESAVAGVGRKVLQALADAPKEEVAHVASSFEESSGVERACWKLCCSGGGREIGERDAARKRRGSLRTRVGKGRGTGRRWGI
jgi:hypothetical protein